MDHKQGDPEELKQKFWQALADSPFVFLERKEQPGEAVVMTAKLDKNANGAVWFFTKRDNQLARMGPAVCTFAAKGHQIFARFEGVLTEETSRDRLEKEWDRITAAWYDQGKDDPNLLMLRMDLGGAEIWDTDIGLYHATKMLLGGDVRDEVAEHHARTSL